MDLKKINDEYLKLKKSMEKASNAIKVLADRANHLVDDKVVFQGMVIEAKRRGSKADEDIAKKEIEKIDKEIKAIKDSALKIKAMMEKTQEKIDSKVNEIKENPEMKKHLDEVMAKKYSRKLSKIEKEKEEAVAKKERFTELQKLVKDHPALGNNLKGILTASKQIKDYEKELDKLKTVSTSGAITYTDPVRANDIMNNLIPQAKAKITTNKTPLMDYINKKSLNIKEEDIDELADKNIAVNKNGEINLDATMNKGISSINRQIKGYDKQIKDHQKSLGKIDDYRAYVAPRTATTPGVEAPGTVTPSTPAPAEQPKWYQFIQKFRNWNERRKQRALPEGTETSTRGSTSRSAERNEFVNSLKYDIVRDTVEQMEKDSLKEAKRERKQEEAER